jgi:hypothetical protein
MTDEPNDIDTVMSKDPLSMTDLDLKVVIAYYRNQRAYRENGGKAKKDAGPKTKLDLTALGLKVAGPDVKRRI